MSKFIVLFVMTASMFGCASTSSVSAVQTQLDAHVATMTADHKAMDAKNAEQDASIAELSARMDRAFVKAAK
jgi:hypothetical protein